MLITIDIGTKLQIHPSRIFEICLRNRLVGDSVVEREKEKKNTNHGLIVRLESFLGLSVLIYQIGY